MTTINRWLGIAQSRAEQRLMIPKNITPGSVWLLRVGTRTYSYTYPATIEVTGLTSQDIAKTVVDGIIEAFEGGGTTLGGGSDTTSLTLSTELHHGEWAVLATGPSDGTPLDVTLTGSDPTAATVSVVQLQAGQSQRNEIQRIKWPQTPTGGNLKLRFADGEATVAYNASAATVQTALEAITAIGAGNVTVTGSYSTAYQVEFKGTLAGKNVELLTAVSNDCTGTAAYTVEKIQSAQVVRQTYTLAKLSGDANELFQFSLSGEAGHLFTGSSDAAALLAALESVPTIGAGNVSVERQPDGTSVITLIGRFVGLEVEGLEISAEGKAVVPTLSGSSPGYAIRKTQLRFRIFNMPDASLSSSSSYFRLYSGSTYTGNIAAAEGSTLIGLALSSATLPWTCISATGGRESIHEFVLEYTAGAQLPVDAPLVLADVSTLKGCMSIDVRTAQAPLSNKNEVQQISIATDPTGGTFTLGFGVNTTSGLAYNASAATIQTALEGLASIGAGNAAVSGPVGGPWIVEFKGTLAAADKALIVGNGASLTLPTTSSVAVTQLVTPTGPNWWTNASNWSLGEVPNGSHIATLENCAIACKYGIQGVPAFAGLDSYRSFTGGLGLPSKRADGSPETLPTDLTLTDNTALFVLRVGLGDEGSGPPIVRIDAGTQNVQASILYTGTSNNGDYACTLAGAIDELIVGSASLGIAVTAGSTATVLKMRVKPGSQGETTVEWGEGATVGSVQVQGGTIRAGTVPSSLFINGGDGTVRGVGSIDALTIRNATVRWLAEGGIGKQGLISAMTVDGDGQALVTSASHGLTSGARVFLSGVAGVVGLPDGFYTVAVVNANSFALVGTAPTKPYGAVDPSTVSSYYQTNTARWGLASAVTLGEEAVLDLSELAVLRTVGAPIVLQAASAQFNDPLVTIKRLRMRHDPGPLEETLGIGCVIMRDEHAAATAQPGNPSGAGGLAAA